jgi:hypothetical protein
MRFQITSPAAACTYGILAAAVLFVAGCGGSGSPTAPAPPTGEGVLFFVDSGCSCENNPPGIPITVDGKPAGTLPALGNLAIDLPPGNHTWTYAGQGATVVVIQAGQTVTVNLQSNFGCIDGCVADMSLRR